MAEREQYLPKSPEQNNNTTLAEALTTTYLAHKDLQRAITIQQYQNEIDPKGAAFRNVYIGEAQIALGVNSDQTIEDIRTAAITMREKADTGYVNLYCGIARLQAKRHEYEAAKQTIDSVLYKDDGFYSPMGYVDVGEIVLENGDDPEIFIEAAIGAVDNNLIDDVLIFHHSKIAKLQKSAGKNPAGTLEKMRVKLDKPDYDRERKLWDSRDLIKSYAYCGYFDEATKLTKGIKYTRMKAELFAYIAERRIAEGNTTSAVSEQSLKEALDSPDTYEKAVNIADIAWAQNKAGTDSRQIYSQAFESADKIFPAYVEAHPGTYGMSGTFVAFEQLEAYKEIAENALESGYDEFVDVAIERIDKFEQENGEDPSMNNPERIELLTKRAIFRAKKGLLTGRINNLTPNEIQAIMTSGLPGVEEAVAYFNLQNKSSRTQ